MFERDLFNRETLFWFPVARFWSARFFSSFSRFLAVCFFISLSLMSLTGSRGRLSRVSFLKKQLGGRFSSKTWYSLLLGVGAIRELRLRVVVETGLVDEESTVVGVFGFCTFWGSFKGWTFGCWATKGAGFDLKCVLLIVFWRGLNLEICLFPLSINQPDP